MMNDTLSVAAVLRRGIALPKLTGTFAVPAIDLKTADERDWMAQALQTGDALRVAPDVFAVRAPTGTLAMLKMGLKVQPSAPPPHETAIALYRQNNWRLSIPPVFAQFLLGLAERPLALPQLPYDQPKTQHYPNAGLTLRPADRALFDLSIAGQALSIALPREASAAKLIEIGSHAARGILGLPSLIEALECDIDADRLGERELITATSIVEATRDMGLILRAPPDWQPPPETESVVRIEGWRIRRLEDAAGEYYCLSAPIITGHPILGNTNLSQSSPLIWLDERSGYARTVSRLYRLGRRVPYLDE